MKRTNLILVILGVVSLLLASALAQQLLPPKAGTYYCYTSQYNPAQAIVYSISYTPAFFGNVILDGKGNYTLTGRKTSGKYMFDKASGIVTFTGDLKIMRYQNVPSQKDTFLLLYQDLAFVCGLTNNASKPQGSSGTAPATAAAKTLNQGLTGKIMATISDENNLFLGSVFEFDLAKGTYSTVFGSGAAQRNAKGEIIYFDKTSRLKLTDKTGNKTLKQYSDQVRYNFPDFYPALSHDGAFVAINRGDTLEVIDRNGEKISAFPGLRQASWTPDGRIVAVGDGNSNRGLFLIDNQFRDAQRIVEGYDEAQTPAVSPDGKRIAFFNLDKVLTITLDGQNPVEVIIGSRMSFPTWSPDGKYLAVNIFYTANVDQNHIFIANLAADKGFFLEDSAGKRVNSRNRISWTP
jgi:Tol biopolymer transport system component